MILITILILQSVLDSMPGLQRLWATFFMSSGHCSYMVPCSEFIWEIMGVEREVMQGLVWNNELCYLLLGYGCQSKLLLIFISIWSLNLLINIFIFKIQNSWEVFLKEYEQKFFMMSFLWPKAELTWKILFKG